jgi:hypothetical protein
MTTFVPRSVSLILLAWLLLVARISPAEVRTWTDATGKFRRSATFQRVNGDSVILQTPDGQQLRIALDQLSAADRAYVRSTVAKETVDDPFRSVSTAPEPQPADLASVKEASGAVRVVVAKGVGTTVEEAKKDAYREAVRQVVGAYVEGDTLTRNDELIEDKVLALSGALVEKADIIAESLDTSGGLTRLRVRAEVKVTEVMKSLATINITTTAVRTSDIDAQVTTVIDQTQAAEAMLSDLKMWDSFPASFFSMTVAGQPKVIKARGDDATVELLFRLSPDREKYLVFASRLTAILGKLGGPRGAFTIDGKTPGGDPGRRKANLDGLWHHTLVSSRNRANLACPEITYAFPEKDRKEIQGFFQDMGEHLATQSGCLVYCFNQDARRPPYGCGLSDVSKEWMTAIGRRRDELMIVCLMTQANESFNRTKWEWFACDHSLFPGGVDSPWNRGLECEFTICAADGREIAGEILQLSTGFGVSREDWKYHPKIVMLGPMWIEAKGEPEQRSAYAPRFTFPQRIELSATEAALISEVKCVVRPRLNVPR